MTGQWCLIVNLAAGGGSVKAQWPDIEAALKSALPVAQVVFTEYPKHAMELVAAVVQAGCRHIIAVGGDGTNHEVSNGIMMQRIVPPEKITYALLPVGTGNDWARMYGIPAKLQDWLAMMQAGHTRLQDVGLIDYVTENGASAQRYFVNVAGMAYDAFVVHYADSRRSTSGGRFFYLWMILRCLFEYRHVKSQVQYDGQTEENYYYTINIGICRYNGGGIQMTPQAVPDDGLLALTLAGRISKLGVILNTWRFYNGSIGKHPKVRTMQTKEVVVQAAEHEAILLEADGEFLGQAPASFRVLHQVLRIVVPSKQQQFS